MKDYFFSDAKYLKLDITIPYKEMLAEAKQLRSRFIEHRGGDSTGWHSLTLHGLGEDKTDSWQAYGFATSIEASNHMHWTPAADLAPITKNFLLNDFPCNKYGRVRFMLLEAGGKINLHSDSRAKMLENTNIVLNNPAECVWRWGDGSPDLYMEDGIAYAMNISYFHELENNSNEDRYHMIIARHDSTDEWKSLIDTAALRNGVTGQYISINELP